MEERYIITVVGKQTVDGESDTIEVQTEGDMTIDENKVTIVYPEYSVENPTQKNDTTVMLCDGVLSIDRQGEMSSHLIIEEGKRHECLYNTPMGQIFVGIFTDSIKVSLDEHGGKITAAYQLDFNRTVVSYNEFIITLKEKG